MKLITADQQDFRPQFSDGWILFKWRKKGYKRSIFYRTLCWKIMKVQINILAENERRADELKKRHKTKPPPNSVSRQA